MKPHQPFSGDADSKHVPQGAAILFVGVGKGVQFGADFLSLSENAELANGFEIVPEVLRF
jgi:hypothetical protein